MANLPQSFSSCITHCTTIAALLALAATPALAKDKRTGYPVQIVGGDEKSFSPPPNRTTIKDAALYDAIIVGGGLAGLSAAVYLTDQHKKVLLIDKEPVLGGLAAGRSDRRGGARYDRGAAYWTDAYEEENEILTHIGLGEFRKKFAIPEPIDSYLWNGEMYLGIWEHETVERLPASFAVFKTALLLANKHGQIPNQPFEEATDLSLDALNAADWVRKMPELVKEAAERDPKDAELAHVLERFEKDPRIDRADPMKDVIGLLDLYCRSALGATTDRVSAVAFANFYISEIETRYTTTTGTGSAAKLMVEMLKKRRADVTAYTSAAATKVTSDNDGVTVTYNRGGNSYEAHARYGVFAAQLKIAPKLIDGLAATEQGKLMASLDYSHYSVHVAFVAGHPYRATYDTWVRAKDYSGDDFTDVILGRWMDPKIGGYEGMRELGPKGFKKSPRDREGILSIYHPLAPGAVGKGYDDEFAKGEARRAVDRLLSMWPPTIEGKKLATPLVVKSVETSRWPYSVHVAAPLHFTNVVKKLRRPFGRVFFANNNMGTPSFEEALFRGHCAANRILLSLDPAFKFETWTKCPGPEKD